MRNNNVGYKADQTLPLLDVYADSCYLDKIKTVELNDTTNGLLLSNVCVI